MSLECLNCEHLNEDDARFCENCGTSLFSVAHIDPMATETLVIEKIEVAKEAERQEASESERFSRGTVLNIHVQGQDRIIRIRPSEAILFGRSDPRLSINPEIDLTDYGGAKLGISRNHAALQVKDDALYLIDMRSSNGTFHNGDRVDAHSPRRVRHGDTIQLGKMVMTVRFEN